MQNNILRQSRIFILFPLAFILVGLFTMFVFANKQAKKEKNCTHEITGIITDVSLKREYSGTGSKRRVERYYVGDVEYTVNNEQYTRYIKTKHHISEGQKVDVLYNNSDPSEAILPRYDTTSGILRIIGGVFMIIGGLIFVLLLAPSRVLNLNV